MATPKQEKLIKLLIENYGKKGETKTLGQILVDAGYSEESAKNPHLLIGSSVVQEGIEDFIKTLTDKRGLAITKISEEKLEKSSARDLASIVDTLTKNHQLLTGGDTERGTQPLLVKIIGQDDETNKE